MVGHAVMKQDEAGAHLSLLLIKPEHQHQGIGRSMMKLLMVQAGQAHWALTLTCFLSDERAIGFYQRLGFTLMCSDEHSATYRYSADCVDVQLTPSARAAMIAHDELPCRGARLISHSPWFTIGWLTIISTSPS